MDAAIIQSYVNNLRTRLTSFLKPNISIQIDIYNCEDQGGVLVIHFKPGGLSFDNEITEYSKISEVLSQLNQKFYVGNIDSITFKGTHLLMEPSRIILIKESNPSEWSIQKLNKDLDMIFQPPRKSKKS